MTTKTTKKTDRERHKLFDNEFLELLRQHEGSASEKDMNEGYKEMFEKSNEDPHPNKCPVCGGWKPGINFLYCIDCQTYKENIDKIKAREIEAMRIKKRIERFGS
jgi:hypothetical protein